jgi:hypothetical protein
MSPKHPKEATLTDSVRCTADSSNSITCEVQLDSDFETLTGEVPQPPPARPPQFASDPAVSSLVSSFVSKTVVPAPPAPLLSSAALLKCSSSELSVLLAAAAATKSPILATVSMLKAGIELSECWSLAHDDAAQRNATDYCSAQGGHVVRVEDDNTVCEVRETLK